MLVMAPLWASSWGLGSVASVLGLLFGGLVNGCLSKKKKGREWLQTLGEEREKKNIEREREKRTF